ncbi:ATP-binding cassette subfamily G member 4-like [Diadema setosum]|uniref:ATP-binding cassette subfamily G member 4-like n=1 Tax=Diadema setosum TaxID=31175 RepID=UPI003B3BE7DB
MEERGRLSDGRQLCPVVVVDMEADPSTDRYSQLNEDILEEIGDAVAAAGDSDSDSNSDSGNLQTVVVVDQARRTIDRTKGSMSPAAAASQVPHSESSDELVQSVKSLTTQIKQLTDNTKRLAQEGLSLRNELERVADQVDQAEKSDELTQLLAAEKLKHIGQSGSDQTSQGHQEQPMVKGSYALELQDRKSPEVSSAGPSPGSPFKQGEPRTPETQKLTNLPSRPPVKLEFENIAYSIQQGDCCKRNRVSKTILGGLTGCFMPGELIAIMGPSGAGKSSFMNVLAGYKTTMTKGTVLVNGELRDSQVFRRMSCYIMQDSHLLPHLTTREAMYVAAGLKLPRRMKWSEKKAVIEEIMSLLGLMECAKTRTSQLSGGQTKRLAIAQELVNNPPVMFFDEPTSGLDSLSSLQCVSLLKSLAHGGRTVICTIHQPSAKLFEMFDKLYILAEGHCLYRGTVHNLVPYLKSKGHICPPYHNPADYVIELASGEYGAAATQLVKAVEDGHCESFSSNTSQSSISQAQGDPQGPQRGGMGQAVGNGHSPVASHASNGIATVVFKESNGFSTKTIATENKLPDFLTTTFGTDIFMQFWVLFKRTLITISRDPTLTHTRFSSHVVIGVLIGLLYLDIGDDAGKAFNNAGFLFLSMLFLMFSAMMPTVLSFPLEMNVLIREHLNYWYSLKSYYIAKMMADLPFQILMPTVYCTIVYWMTGQPSEGGRFTLFVAMAIMTSLVAQSLGLIIGAGLPLEVAVFVGPVSSIPILLFSGFFVTLENIPDYLQWMSYGSFVRYSYEGVIISIYGLNRSAIACKSGSVCIFETAQDILDELDIGSDNLELDFGVLLVFFVVLRLICYFILRLKVKRLL